MIPAVLSLFAAQRSIRTAAVTVTDLAAATAVAGAIRSQTVTVVHDDFRLVHGNTVYTMAKELDRKRQQLVGQKVTLEDQKIVAAAGLVTAQAELLQLMEVASVDQDALNTISVHQSSVRIGQIDSLVTAIDAFAIAIRTIPAGTGRSALAAAALHEQLHNGTGEFGHVLLVKQARTDLRLQHRVPPAPHHLRLNPPPSAHRTRHEQSRPDVEPSRSRHPTEHAKCQPIGLLCACPTIRIVLPRSRLRE